VNGGGGRRGGRSAPDPAHVTTNDPYGSPDQDHVTTNDPYDSPDPGQFIDAQTAYSFE
jgi:hypothetical protein